MKESENNNCAMHDGNVFLHISNSADLMTLGPRNSSHFIIPESLFPCSQEPATTSPKPIDISPHPDTVIP